MTGQGVVPCSALFFVQFAFCKVQIAPRSEPEKSKTAQKIVSTNYAVPTGNLDSKTSADVLGLLQRTSREFDQTLVMITHNNAIAQLADRIVRIEDGKIVR